MEYYEIEEGGYYILNAGTPVWSSQYQQKIAFCNDVVVEVTDETYEGWKGQIVASNVFCDFCEDAPLFGEVEFTLDAVKCRTKPKCDK